jgi:hypothetical protein
MIELTQQALEQAPDCASVPALEAFAREFRQTDGHPSAKVCW